MYPPEQAYVLFYAHSGVSIQHVLCKIPQILIKKKVNWKLGKVSFVCVDKHACKYVLHMFYVYIITYGRANLVFMLANSVIVHLKTCLQMSVPTNLDVYNATQDQKESC